MTTTMRLPAMLLPVLLTAILACGPASAADVGYELPLSGTAKVTLAQGVVTVERRGAVSPLGPGDALTAPARVSVGLNGRLELLMPEGSVLRFAQGTEFTLVSALADLRNRNVQVDVKLGDAWATVSDFFGQGEDTFTLDSPTAVAGVAGTRYRLSTDPSRGTSYLVYDGRVNVASRPPDAPRGPGAPGVTAAPHRVRGPQRVAGPHRVTREQWNVIVAQGYRFAITPGGRHQAPEPFDQDRDAADPWVRWNLDRDAAMGR